jgi:hypothetical protein
MPSLRERLAEAERLVNAAMDECERACARALTELGGNGRGRGGLRNECGGAAPKLSTNRPVAPAAEGGLRGL